MKQYIGTKTVQAEPMSRGEAIERGLIRQSAEGNAERLNPYMSGYHVVYEDGYESWSPAEPFEKAYKVADTWSDRLDIEVNGIRKKSSKLVDFTYSDKFKELPLQTQALMWAQLHAMQNYEYAAGLRLVNNITPDDFNNLDFGTAIHLLEHGFLVQRKGWNGKGLYVIKQVPAKIGEEIIPKMQSLPDQGKAVVLANTKHIDYTSQCLIYNSETGRAYSWVPSISDVFATDWQLVIV